MPLATIQNLTIGYRGPALLDDVSCVIESGQRIGLLGRNGAGKTTLMRLLHGTETPNAGKILLENGTKVALLSQDVPRGVDGTIYDIVEMGIGPNDVDESKPWEKQNLVEQILSRMSLDGTSPFDTLSSGMKRRVLLAQALVAKPDLLLLDEPTNHLDIEAIDWLEQFLRKWNGTLIFVTHDRVFLRNLATRILEIDRGRLFDWSCDYETFLKRKEEALEAEEKQNALFDKRLAEEEVWIRKGIKARRTRNEGRVRALKKLREERSHRREHSGTSNLQIRSGERSGNMVVEAKGLSCRYGDNSIFENFSTAIMRGDKIGILGPNGIGKSTLLKALLGKLDPAAGSVRHGTNLQISYFDQLREQLDPEKTVFENVGDGYDHIEVGGEKKHVIGYLQSFLFSPERSRTMVKFISGGERNRILLAKLFARPANLIVLDEPTNDLDSETLEMLEERIVPFAGTVLIVSHDREFLNNVVSSTLVFEKNENGALEINEYVGGYDDWKRQRDARDKSAQAEELKKKSVSKSPKQVSAPKANQKLKYKEQKELDALPGVIEKLESDLNEIHSSMADPGFYKADGESIARKQRELKQSESDLQTAYARWEELEERSSH